MWYVCLTVATHMNAQLYCLLHTYEMLSSQQLQVCICSGLQTGCWRKIKNSFTLIKFPVLGPSCTKHNIHEAIREPIPTILWFEWCALVATTHKNQKVFHIYVDSQLENLNTKYSYNMQKMLFGAEAGLQLTIFSNRK